MKKGRFLSQYESYLTNGHDYVEIAGIKWATMNVGAKKVTDHGLYFQWGDTKGHTASEVGGGTGQKAFTWIDYKYYSGTGTPSSAMTKYNAADGKKVLDLCDDMVYANWGGGWRMPTTEEFAALGKAVTTAWTSDYQGSGVSGLVLTDKVDSSKVLFFPAAGLLHYGIIGKVGCYWCSSLHSSPLYAFVLRFNIGYAGCLNDNRYFGAPVRGVIG